MDDFVFKETISDYAKLMKAMAPVKGTADWQSKIWMIGTRQCSDMASAYIRPHSKVLDFGCGMGLISVLMQESGHDVIGIDIDVGQQDDEVQATYDVTWGTHRDEIENPNMLQDVWKALETRYAIKYYPFDGKIIPFDDRSFDAVIAHAVLEHISPSTLSSTLAEISRVIRNGGHLLIFRTPRKKAWIEALIKLLGMGGHELLYSEEDVEGLANRFGLTLEYKTVTDMLPSFPPYGLEIYNRMTPLLDRIDRFMLKTPLRAYAHHMAMVFRKE